MNNQESTHHRSYTQSWSSSTLARKSRRRLSQFTCSACLLCRTRIFRSRVTRAGSHLHTVCKSERLCTLCSRKGTGNTGCTASGKGSSLLRRLHSPSHGCRRNSLLCLNIVCTIFDPSRIHLHNGDTNPRRTFHNCQTWSDTRGTNHFPHPDRPSIHTRCMSVSQHSSNTDLQGKRYNHNTLASPANCKTRAHSLVWQKI